MKTATLGSLGAVSRLTLGGGGIGQIWGDNTKDEALATLTAAIDGGITLLDAAPMYGNCEAFIGEVFDGRLPAGVKVTTKHQLGSPPAAESRGPARGIAAGQPRRHAAATHRPLLPSLQPPPGRLRLHPPQRATATPSRRTGPSIVGEVVPALERLKAQGRIGAWGITGIGVPTAVLAALDQAVRPDAVQVISNLMDSPGALKDLG